MFRRPDLRQLAALRHLASRFRGVALGAAVAALAALTSGCLPPPTGARQPSPYFPGGPRGCSAVCAQGGMAVASFTYHGELGSTCTCAPPARPASPVPIGRAASQGLVDPYDDLDLE
jgi:hypothetical protein